MQKCFFFFFFNNSWDHCLRTGVLCSWEKIQIGNLPSGLECVYLDWQLVSHFIDRPPTPLHIFINHYERNLHVCRVTWLSSRWLSVTVLANGNSCWTTIGFGTELLWCTSVETGQSQWAKKVIHILFKSTHLTIRDPFPPHKSYLMHL